MHRDRLINMLENLELIMGLSGCSLPGIVAEQCAQEIYDHLGVAEDDRFTVTTIGTC